MVHHGDAAEIGAALDRYELPTPDVILSGIPFSTMARGTGRDILHSVHDSLHPGGLFVAYQVRDRVESLGREVFGRARVQTEILNVCVSGEALASDLHVASGRLDCDGPAQRGTVREGTKRGTVHNGAVFPGTEVDSVVTVPAAVPDELEVEAVGVVRPPVVLDMDDRDGLQ